MSARMVSHQGSAAGDAISGERAMSKSNANLIVINPLTLTLIRHPAAAKQCDWPIG